MPRNRRRTGGRRLLAVALLAALPATGCAQSDEPPTGPATTLSVTRDFGHESLARYDSVPLERRDTLLRQLSREEDVRPGGGGEWVEAIDGLRQHFNASENRSYWVSNVNGVETDVFANEYRLFAGDVVQWDLRYWEVTLDVRATVGAFPETFTRGVFGKRFPVSIECADRSATACAKVKAAFRRAGVPAGHPTRRRSQLPPAGNPQRARVLVGPWSELRRGSWASRVDEGPGRSGVFARFSPHAGTLRLLDERAHRVREEGAGTGLIAAMRPTEEDLLWMVTGVDDDGVERAAAALESDELSDAFAAAVTADGIEKLPVERDGDR